MVAYMNVIGQNSTSSNCDAFAQSNVTRKDDGRVDYIAKTHAVFFCTVNLLLA
jgi:hypothetical protein